MYKIVIVMILVSFLNVVWLFSSGITKDNCDDPLPIAVIYDNTTGTLSLTEQEFTDIVDTAITNWELVTDVDLFTRTASSSNTMTYTTLRSGINDSGTTTTVKDEKRRVVLANSQIYVPLYQVVAHELAHMRGLMLHATLDTDILYHELGDKNQMISDNDARIMKAYCGKEII